jgi:hypothetical protein
MDPIEFQNRLSAPIKLIEEAREAWRAAYVSRLRVVLCKIIEMYAEDVQKDANLITRGKYYICPGYGPTANIIDEEVIHFLTEYWMGDVKQGDIDNLLVYCPCTVKPLPNTPGFFVVYKT